MFQKVHGVIGVVLIFCVYVSMWMISVSYTHLDVYKRQVVLHLTVHFGECKPPGNGGLGKSGPIGTE